MKEDDKTKKQLVNELTDLKKRIAELEASKTDSNCTEEVLRNRKNKYKTLIENIPQKIFYKDNESVYVSCNSNYARDLKITPDEITGKTDYDFYPTEKKKKYRADDKRIMKSGSSKTLDETYTQDGKEVVVRTVKNPVRNDKGNIVGVLGIFWDITERKRYEELLEASEIKFRTLFENAGGAMFIGNAETGEVLDCNKQAEKLIGRRRDKIIGMHQSELHPQGEEDKYKKKFAQHAKKGHAVDYEGEVQHRDGRRIPVWIGARTIQIGSKEMIVGIFIDIAERKQREKEIEENRDFLENIFDTSLDGIYVTDSKGLLTMVNKSAGKILGYSKDELIG
ncbi:MAG: PAS domain S-box protein, partial [Deltaproteobacteria bacterium]|nr:PAS domain S-box protein [Deltaproteobacteria bacterium]